MKRSAILLLVIILIAAMVISACGKKDEPETSAEATSVLTQVEEANAVPTKKPAAVAQAPETVPEPAATAVSTADEEAELSVEDRQSGLENFDSYKAQWAMTWEAVEDGKTETGSWKWVEERVKDPLASRLTWSTESDAGDTGSMEIIEVGGTRYTVMVGPDGTRGCIASMSDEASSTDSMFSPGSLGKVSGARFVGRETVNGMPARHYRYDEKAAALTGFAKLRGDIWVGEDSETVLKETAVWEGGVGLFGMAQGTDGKGSWTWEITEVNQPIDIQPPEECETESSKLPVLPDAQEKIQAGDAVIYQSPTALDDVVEFYRTELTAAGWTEQEGGMTTADMVMLAFTKEEMTAQLMASRQDNMTSVSISISE